MRPSMITVQAPQAPRSQTRFWPVISRRVRSASSSVTRGSTDSACRRPFTVSVMATSPGPTGGRPLRRRVLRPGHHGRGDRSHADGLEEIPS